MFAALMALGPVYLSGLTFAVLTIFFAARRIINDRRIYHAGGVRANVMATNPLFGAQPRKPTASSYLLILTSPPQQYPSSSPLAGTK
jgi:hypothetical protein